MELLLSLPTAPEAYVTLHFVGIYDEATKACRRPKECCRLESMKEEDVAVVE